LPSCKSFSSFVIFPQGVPNFNSTQRSKPYHPATFQANIKKKLSNNSLGLELTVPAKRKATFITAPKKAAIPVNMPTIKPMPTNTSPHATTKENNVAFGRQKISKNAAYHACTSFVVEAFSIAPCK